jgi:hypothetical protein
MRPVALLPCAGDAGRWGNHLGVPKQLTPVGNTGETLLGRTLRLLRRYGVVDLHVLTHQPAIHEAGLAAHVVAPAVRTYLSDTIRSSRPLWGDRTLIVLGDVYLSEQTIRDLVNRTAPLDFLGVMADSPPVRDAGGRPELFALSFDRSESDRVYRTLALNSILASLRDSGGAWFWSPRRMRTLIGFDPLRAESGWTRRAIVERFFHYGFRHDAPKFLERLGCRRNRMWHGIRRLRGWTPDCTRNFGKLWGAYMLLAGLDLSSGLTGDGPAAWAPLFTEVLDYAQDFDTPSDATRLERFLATRIPGAG